MRITYLKNSLNYSRLSFLAILILLMLISCRQNMMQRAVPLNEEKIYKSDLAFNLSPQQLEEIAGSVKKLYCIVEYDVYQFNENDQMNREKLGEINLKRSSAKRSAINESVHGSATVLQSGRNGILLLTCAHVVNNPDTVIAFFANTGRGEIIESIAVKRSQLNFIRNDENNILLRIFAIDSKLDVAFLGSVDEGNSPEMIEFRHPVGNASALHWGTPVYLMGYPGGHQMLTRAIVGNPNSSSSGDFIVDATFNPGGSGSLIFALGENQQTIEMVGIAKSASASFSNLIKPEKESHQETYNPNLPYQGDLYVTRARNINYGVTFAISINTIRDFYIQNRRLLTREGYNLDEFFSLN